MLKKTTYSYLNNLQVKALPRNFEKLAWHIAYLYDDWGILGHSISMQNISNECMKIIEQYNKDPNKTFIVRGEERNFVITFYFIDEQDYINYFVGF